MSEGLLVYQQLLLDVKLLPLSAFNNRRLKKIDLFPDAHDLPQFFSHNLLNSGRVVKVLKGPEAVWRAFYYQLMKVGFEVEGLSKDYSSIIKSLLFYDCNSESSINSSPISGQEFSQRQNLRVVADFIQLLQNELIPNFQMTLTRYPIFDEAMLSCLQNILQKQLNVANQVTSILEVLEILCSLFSIHLEIFQNCVKFVESDVFIYFQDAFQVYMAYLNQMAQIEENDLNSEDSISQKKTQTFFHSTNNENKRIYEKQNQWIPKTQLNSRNQIQNSSLDKRVVETPELTSSIEKKNLFDAQSEFQKETLNQQIMPNTVQISKKKRTMLEDFNILTVQSQNQNVSSQKSHKNSEKKGQYSSSLSICNEVKDYFYFQRSETPEIISNFSKSKGEETEKQELFHHPRSRFSTKKSDLKFESQEKNKHESDDTLGTFYHQFTNTRVLEAMNQPFRTEVKKTRNRFRGIRSKNYFGFT